MLSGVSTTSTFQILLPFWLRLRGWNYEYQVADVRQFALCTLNEALSLCSFALIVETILLAGARTCTGGFSGMTTITLLG